MKTKKDQNSKKKVCVIGWKAKDVDLNIKKVGGYEVTEEFEFPTIFVNRGGKKDWRASAYPPKMIKVTFEEVSE